MRCNFDAAWLSLNSLTLSAAMLDVWEEVQMSPMTRRIAMKGRHRPKTAFDVYTWPALLYTPRPCLSGSARGEILPARLPTPRHANHPGRSG